MPALKIDGRKVVGSRKIARALDQIVPEPPLFPADPERRRAVEEAEEWGERELQPAPRRLMRWALSHDAGKRTYFARALGMPAPRLAGAAFQPTAMFFARRENANSDEQIRADAEAFDARIDHVDELIESGVLNGPERNAADFQIGTSVRVLLAFDDFRDRIEGRPAETLAREVWPDFPYEVPPLLPAGWR